MNGINIIAGAGATQTATAGANVLGAATTSAAIQHRRALPLSLTFSFLLPRASADVTARLCQRASSVSPSLSPSSRRRRTAQSRLRVAGAALLYLFRPLSLSVDGRAPCAPPSSSPRHRRTTQATAGAVPPVVRLYRSPSRDCLDLSDSLSWSLALLFAFVLTTVVDASLAGCRSSIWGTRGEGEGGAAQIGELSFYCVAPHFCVWAGCSWACSF